MNDQTPHQGGKAGGKHIPHRMSAENLSDPGGGGTHRDQGGGGGGMSSSNDTCSSGESNKTSPHLNKVNQQTQNNDNTFNNTNSTSPQSPRSRGRLFRMLGGEKYLQRQREREQVGNSQNPGNGVSPSLPFSPSPSPAQNRQRREEVRGGEGNQVKRKSTIPLAPPSATGSSAAPAVSSGSVRGSITTRMIVDNLPPIFSSEASSFSSSAGAGQKASGAPSRGEDDMNSTRREFKSPLKKISGFFSSNNNHNNHHAAEDRRSGSSNINRRHSRQQPQTPVRAAGSNGAAKKETPSDHNNNNLVASMTGPLRSPLGKVSDADQKPVVTGVNTEFIEISCTRLFFPHVGDTVTLPTVTAAPSTAHSSSNATPLHQSVNDGGEGSRGGLLLMSPASAFAAKSDGGLGAGIGLGAVGRGLLPPSFTAYDVENIVHLRAALGTTGGLISSDVSREATVAASSASASLSMASSAGVVKRAAPPRYSTLLCGHPLILYKVRSSAAHAFSCAPCYGMLQRYPGDTVNVLSPSDLLDGTQATPSVSDFDFAGVLSAVERASERLVVSIRHPSAPHASERPQHASDENRETAKTREIEKIRIEFVVVLDAPTKQEVKNVIRTSAAVPNQLVSANSRPPAAVGSQAPEHSADKNTMMPSTTLAGEKSHDGSPRVLVESPAAVLKSIQPVLALLFEELKDQVPLSERSAAGDGGTEEGGEERRRSGSAQRTRARSATPSRHGSGPAARNPLQGLEGPLLTVSTQRKRHLAMDGVGNNNEDEEGQSAVVKIGHADLTCFMGCGEELASYLPTRDRRDSLFVHYGASSHTSAFDRHALLTDEEFEKKYVTAGSGDRKVSTLVHPLPIPFGATITLKNMRQQNNNNSSHKGSSAKSSSEKGSAQQPFIGAASGAGEDTYSRRSTQDSTLPLLEQHSSTAPPTPIVSGSGGSERRNAALKRESSSRTAVAPGGSKVGAKQKLSVLSRLFKVQIHFSLVLLMVVFVYAFAYCWRRTDMTMSRVK